MQQTPLTKAELVELESAFADVMNYDSEDPLAPIDPLTYVAPDDDTCLHIAARRGDARSVDLLLRAGLDVTAAGDMGMTPLHCAGDPDVVNLLIGAGAPLDVQDEFGKLPLERSEGLRPDDVP